MSSKKAGASSDGKRRKSAQETESRILRTAEEVFDRKGYVAGTVADIVERAQVSRGAFYLYFKNKDDVFTAIVSRVVNDLFTVSGTPRRGTFRERVEAANRGYLKAFKRNRRMMRCFFQVAMFDPRMAALHNKLRTPFIRRIRRNLERNIEAGWCHPMNPQVTAYALALMVEWLAYSWLSAGFQPWREPFDLETVVQEVTNLWCRAIYLDGKGAAMPEGSIGTHAFADSISESEVSARKIV